MLALILGLPLLAQTADTPDQLKRGQWLFQSCKGTVRWLDAPSGSKPSDEDDDFANCSSYLNGFIEARSLEGKDRCLDPDVTLGTFVRLYVLYMEKHPKLLDKHRAVGLALALGDAYPCMAPRKHG